MDADKEVATKRRLSFSGRATPGNSSNDDGMGQAEDQKMLDVRFRLQAVEKMAKVGATQSQQTAKQLSAMTLTLTPWNKEENAKFWQDFQMLFTTDVGKGILQEGDITNIDDSKRDEIILYCFQSSKTHGILVQILEEVRKQDYNIRVGHTVTGSKKNVKRLPIEMIKCIKTELDKYQLRTDDVIDSKLPSSLEFANFRHTYKDEKNEIILCKGEVTQVDGVSIMIVLARSQAQIGTDLWDLEEMTKAMQAAVESFEGYPYMINFETTMEEIGEMQMASTNEGATTEHGSKGKSKGKKNGKSKGKGGGGGKSKGKGGGKW